MGSADLAQSIFDVTSAAGAQFSAMLLGALLASSGGFVVAWLLDRMARRRQEQSIALVCLDLVTSLGVMVNLAKGARARGNPYGPFTLRLVRGCLRDLEVYERNRERIADISDPSLRAEIYQCMARMTLAVDGVLVENDLIDELKERIDDARLAGKADKVDELTREQTERAERRDGSFDFMVDTVQELCGDLTKKLRAVAKSEPQNLAAIVAANAVPTPPTPPQS